jgi:hypothetical protein
MARGARLLARLFVGLFAVVLLGFGSVAYASVPVPDPVSDGIAQLAPAAAAPISQGPSLAQELGWMGTGAVLFVLVAAVVAGIAVLSRRHRVEVRQLQMR